ncbi:hypothetical protein A7K94_0222020, partial [Modestobacter sp. VKM Ac-2676]
MSTRGARTNDLATTELAASVEPVVSAAGYDLEELVVRPAGQRSVVRVVIDRDAGVSLDDVAELSRALSEVLDGEDEAFGSAPYVLEVTSPGIDRPLTAPRHWRRNVGRLVDVAVGPDGPGSSWPPGCCGSPTRAWCSRCRRAGPRRARSARRRGSGRSLGGA